jgi:tetratricopeptide (TPR) repeat protein
LTIGLLAMENMFGFNLKSLSGIALGAIFVITGFFMVTLARSAGIGSVTSFAITYCLLYLGAATTLPNLFDYIYDHARWLNGVLAIIFLISLFIAVRATVVYLTSKRKLSNLPDLKPVKNNTDQEIKLEDDELHKLKILRNKLQTVDDLMDALTLLEKSIKKHPVLTQEQVQNARHYLDSISKKEEIFRKNHNDLIRQFKLLGRIDSERLERLHTELSTAPEHLKKYKQAEIDIERRKIEYDKKIIDIRTNLDAFFQTYHQNLVLAIQHLVENSDMSLNHIAQAKDALGHLRNLINVMRRLQGELYDLHKAQKELMRGEQKKRGKR